MCVQTRTVNTALAKRVHQYEKSVCTSCRLYINQKPMKKEVCKLQLDFCLKLSKLVIGWMLCRLMPVYIDSNEMRCVYRCPPCLVRRRLVIL